MKAVLEISMDTPAFAEAPSAECARILRELADRIDGHPHFSPGHDQALHDSDGKEVGFFGIWEAGRQVRVEAVEPEFDVERYDDGTIEGFSYRDNFYPAGEIADAISAAQFDIPVPLRLKWQKMLADEKQTRKESTMPKSARRLLSEIVGEREEAPTSTVDIEVQNHGSIILLVPLTDAGDQWLHENTGEEATWYGGALAVEPRYVTDIVDGAVGDGLVVK